MFCVIYRSPLRDQTYLYVEKKDDFSRVPEELLKGFGKPQLAMVLKLAGNDNVSVVRLPRGYLRLSRAHVFRCDLADRSAC